MPASIMARSDWWQVVEDSPTWSSPATITTPPRGAVPARLAWRNASPDRSTPGPLPYHRPNTPSTRPSSRSAALCVPHTAVAARSSFSPGWNRMSAAFSAAEAPCIARSSPPRGEPR